MRQAWMMVGCLAWTATVCSASYGQQQELAPVANAIGRFFGFGYSAGYHARVENRFGMHHYAPTHNVVPQPPRGIHATASYGGNTHDWMGGTLPYQTPIYTHPYQSVPAIGSGSIGVGRVPSSALPAPVPQPPVPAPPTPSWLKPYLKEAVPPPYAEPIPSNASPSDASPTEISPSDRRGVYRPQPNEPVVSSQLSISPADPISLPPTPPQVTQRPIVSILQQ